MSSLDLHDNISCTPYPGQMDAEVTKRAINETNNAVVAAYNKTVGLAKFSKTVAENVLHLVNNDVPRMRGQVRDEFT